MKFLIGSVFAAVMALASPSSASGPSWGDHVCWSKHPKHANPVLGWHPERKKAAGLSLAKCGQVFGPGCSIDYCERLERK